MANLSFTTPSVHTRNRLHTFCHFLVTFSQATISFILKKAFLLQKYVVRRHTNTHPQYSSTFNSHALCVVASRGNVFPYIFKQRDEMKIKCKKITTKIDSRTKRVLVNVHIESTSFNNKYVPGLAYMTKYIIVK